MDEAKSEAALFWPPGQAWPALVALIGDPIPGQRDGQAMVVMSAGRVRYLVDEADVMRLPTNARRAALSPMMGNA